MYIRVKKINGSFYAYLSECKWSKRYQKPKQKFKKYLGKVYNFNKDMVEILRPEGDKFEFINKLIGNELLSLGFKFENNGYFRDGISINLKNKEVKLSKRTVVLRVNDGFLCDDNLKSLYNFKELHNMNTMKAGEELGKRLLNCGISIDNELFVELFRKIYKNI